MKLKDFDFRIWDKKYKEYIFTNRTISKYYKDASTVTSLAGRIRKEKYSGNLVFDNLKNFFLSVNPAYYMLSSPISMFFVFIVISFLEKRGINGVLVYLLTVIPLLFLFFYYSNAKLSVDYLKSEAMFIIFLILFSSLIAPVAIYEMFREKEEELEKDFY
ncbi:hypothetical protein KX992_001727 [Campylobacter jejuni]|nr:hypothetical protein [Campylobacter jejuni]